MSTGIRNVARRNGKIISKIRGLFEHRAEWLYLVLDEARKKGLAWEDFAPAAVYRCGCYHGAELARSAPSDSGLIHLRKRIFSGIGTRVFEMKTRKSTADELAVDFHYCPLVKAWQKQGASDEDIGKLCDIAMRGDAGIAEAFGARLELGEVIAKGGELCRLRFLREDKA
jgi:hypothetical protein